MAAKLLPTSCVKGEWEERVFNNVSVNAGGPQVVSIDYELNFAKAGLGMGLWIQYTPGTAGNTLTVGALWSTRGGTLFFPSVDGPSVVLRPGVSMPSPPSTAGPHRPGVTFRAHRHRPLRSGWHGLRGARGGEREAMAGPRRMSVVGS
jgi:hypothetical protein